MNFINKIRVLFRAHYPETFLWTLGTKLPLTYAKRKDLISSYRANSGDPSGWSIAGDALDNPRYKLIFSTAPIGIRLGVNLIIFHLEF
jgi:hypothetical protein